MPPPAPPSPCLSLSPRALLPPRPAASTHAPLSPRARSSMSDMVQSCPVNLSFTISRHRVLARWSMRPWESVRRTAGRRRGLLRSHGPSKERVDHQKVDFRLPARRARFVADRAGARAFGQITTMLDRTAMESIRPSEFFGCSGQVEERGPERSPPRGPGPVQACRPALTPGRRREPGRGSEPAPACEPGEGGACRLAFTSGRRRASGRGPEPVPARGPGEGGACRLAFTSGRRRAPGRGPEPVPARGPGEGGACRSAPMPRWRRASGRGAARCAPRGPDRARGRRGRTRARGRAH
jgi:hypothetical protein